MTSASRRIHSRRRLAALTFLSNISLDGTHQDTTLGTLNFNVYHLSKPNTDSPSVSHKECWRYQHASKCGESDTIEHASEVKNITKKTLIYDENISREESEDKVESHYSDCQAHKHKDRVHRFVCEAKAKLHHLNRKRKQLIHHKSIDSGILPVGKSSESLVSGCRSRKASLCPSESSLPAIPEVKYLKNLKDYRNEAQRLVLVSRNKSPVVLFSVLPYQKPHATSRADQKAEFGRRRHTSSARQLSVITDGPDPLDLIALLGIEKPQDGQDVSYGQLLAPSVMRRLHNSILPEIDVPFRLSYHMHSIGCSLDIRNASMQCSMLATTPPKYIDRCTSYSLDKDNCAVGGSTHVFKLIYNPDLLDDPELIVGKHSTLMVFPSYITSVIDYVKPSDLKKNLNDKFRERFPHVQLTLSKLRSLKKEMYKIARHECNIDLSIVAQAFVYFEKLVLKVLVNKQNRKLCAGACLLLAAKLNDIRGTELRNLLEKVESVFRINRKDLMGLEFGVLVALEFSLLLSSAEILPHYQRLLYES